MGILSSLTGTVVNTVLILIGSLIGTVVGNQIPERIRKTLMSALAFCVLYIGVSGMLKGQKVLVMIISMVLGTVIGESFDLDRQVNRLGSFVERKINRGDKNNTPLAEGFVNASLLFCVGAMLIVGSLDSGLRGDHTTLFAKGCIDGVSAIIFSSAFGIGVALSAAPVFILQASIAMLAHLVAPFLGADVIAEVTCVGSLLIIGISLNMLGITKLKIMNLSPAVFLPIVICPCYNWLTHVISGIGG